MPQKDEHFQQLLRWIEMEAVAERDRLAERRKRLDSADAEKHGESLIDLVMEDHRSGIGGRYLVSLVKRNRTIRLPWNRFRVGSPVVLSSEAMNESYLGVVSRRNNRAIEVALELWPDGEPFRLDLSADEVTRQRQRAALGVVVEARGRLGYLREVLLCEKPPKFLDAVEGAGTESDETSALNSSQEAAVRFALSAEDIAVIHGPPGTGKTTTVVEIIVQSVGAGQKVLACAPSNTGVDNLLERLVKRNQNVVRLGHPARVHDDLQQNTLDAIVENDPTMKIVEDMMREADDIFRQADRYTRAKPARGAKREMRSEAKQLRADARRLERSIVKSVLDKADIICATTTIDFDLLGDREFDLVVVDEACQSTEPGCWVPLLRAERVVLAGDHCQLPPTIISTEAAKEGFAISMMERLINHYGEDVSRMLTVQYRMHEQIMEFSSLRFYDGNLVAFDTVKQHLLADLPRVEANTATMAPISFIDSAGADWTEELEPGSESKMNPQEADFVLKKVRELCDAGVDPRDIAVIAPYAAQVRLIRSKSPFERLEIDTVDGFQGREKEAVVISLVRSNEIGEIGFLADVRRMNVAMTRARRKLIMIGDSATLSNNEFYRSLLDHLEQTDGYHSVWEEMA